MTKAEFKRALRCGLGRCIVELRDTKEPEKYYDLVIWACTHDFAFDAQCEGTRAWYAWQLVKCYADAAPFVDTAASKFLSLRSNGGWTFAHCCDLLSLFARDGNTKASDSLREKYHLLYDRLLKRRKRPSPLYHELGDFEMLCMQLCHKDTAYFLSIAEDIGNLFLHNKCYDGFDFLQLQEYVQDVNGHQRVTKALENAAQKSPALHAYLKEYRCCTSQWDANSTSYATLPLPDETALFTSSHVNAAHIYARYLRRGGEGACEKLAKAALAENNPERKAEMLHAFVLGRKRNPWPLNPAPLILLAKTADETLSSVALTVLEGIRHDQVRQYALELLEDPGQKEAGIALLARNYRACDRELFVRTVRSLPIDYNETSGWHGVFLSVLELLEERPKENVPNELLPYIHSRSLCSCCRERALHLLARKHLVKAPMWEECRYDSREEIRTYAGKHLKKQPR